MDIEKVGVWSLFAWIQPLSTPSDSLQHGVFLKSYIGGLPLYKYKYGLTAAASSGRINVGTLQMGTTVCLNTHPKIGSLAFVIDNGFLKMKLNAVIPRCQWPQPAPAGKSWSPSTYFWGHRNPQGTLCTTIGNHLCQMSNFTNGARRITQIDRSWSSKSRWGHRFLLCKHQTNGWMSRIITGEEIWCLFVNIK